MRKLVFINLFGALFLMLSLAIGQQQVVGTAILDEPASLDPVETIQLTAYQVLNQMMEYLVYIGPDNLPHGWVAESWDVSDDGKVITFKIREGRKFHDGTEIDAEAVAFSFNRHLDPENNSANRTGLGTLEQVEVVDDYTVRFTYSEPYAPIWTSLASAFYGVVSPTAVEQYGDEFGRHVVGSGPFKLDEWIPGVGFNLVRFEGYTTPRTDVENKGEVRIDELQVRILPEEGTRIAALETGEIHYGGAPLEALSQFKNDPNFTVVINENNSPITMLEVNPFKAPTDDVLVRKAIAHALNIEDIAFIAYAGSATPNYTPLPTGSTAYDPEIGDMYGYKQDLEKVAEYLQEAGYAKNEAGVWAKDGELLTLTFWTYTLPNGMKGGQLIQQQLQDAGFDVNFETFEVASMIGQLKNLEHNINFMYWDPGYDPVGLSYIFQTPGWAGVYHDAELDEILRRADTELDPDKRQEAVEEAERFLLDNVGMIPIATSWSVLLSRSDLEGLKLSALGEVLLNDAHLVQ